MLVMRKKYALGQIGIFKTWDACSVEEGVSKRWLTCSHEWVTRFQSVIISNELFYKSKNI